MATDLTTPYYSSVLQSQSSFSFFNREKTIANVTNIWLYSLCPVLNCINSIPDLNPNFLAH